MDALTFKTTIKCSGCVAKATPFLNEVAGEDNWEVDITNPNKILRIEADGNLSATEVVAAVEKAGYKAEVVK
jgi:copper chaperone